MAIWVASGALLLVMFTGVSYSHPIKQTQATAFDPSSTYSGYYGQPAYDGYYGQPAYDGYYGQPASPDSTYGGGQAASAGSTFYSPSAPSGSAAIAPKKFVAPAPEQSGSFSSSPSALAQPRPLPSEATWQVKPPTPFSIEERSDVSLSAPASERSVPSNLSPPLPPVPSYQGGELSKYFHIQEAGTSDSETEEQGRFPPPPGVFAPSVAQSPSFQESRSSLSPPPHIPDYFFPRYDYMFLYGEYPPGTVTFSDRSYEQGMDQVEDSHYVREYYPSLAPQQDQFISDVQVPQYMQQASQPMQQSLVHSGAVMVQNQPYGTVDNYQSYPASGYYSE